MSTERIDDEGLAFRRVEGGWLGRSAPGRDFFDLVVMDAAGQDDLEAPDAVSRERLRRMAEQAGTLKERAVPVICAARQARLQWRDGPAPDQWSVVEVCIDPDGRLWLTLHEYETDEYSVWITGFDDREQPDVVRRAPDPPGSGPPGERGEAIWMRE